MSRRIRYSLFFAGLLLLACGNNNYVQEEGFCTALPDQDTVVFEYGKPVALFTSCKDNLPAQVTRVSDSRCPPGVNCIWAGKLDVSIDMAGLALNLEKDKVVDTFFRNNRYSFFLVDALPAPSPGDSIRPEQKKVYIKITRANRSRPVEPGNMLPVGVDSGL